MRVSLGLAFLLASIAACRATVPAAAMAPIVDVPDRSHDPDRPDPLCGEHYRWDGTRCIELPASEIPKVATEPAAMGIEIEELAPGNGKQASSGDTVRVNY